ncbi:MULTISPECIES: UbiD family decarboxylase [unclassified Achromobacter]|uniref:UbiD family decarboxylase n=1 Tax=unclassified Achromobacter TaxID=2626865 RepID=UPI000B514E90|nr:MULTISPECIES: UbiD family decarboxylase [unclassified Achromobacter]OWT80056.1 3-octaprenyl-4-hydroxybenzoate carboxy-lyase [Achromobacter sp. HZ34]OWT81939.1 3-octaprenyl-4-hydroxybenzoate carboxy-lyase [Achromobacter sp. HZ28]
MTQAQSRFRRAPHTDLRGWLNHLAATDRLAVIKPGAALEHELAAIAKRLDGKQAAYFPEPGGHAVPVVSGFMARRGWIAEAMGVAEAELLTAFRNAAAEPLPAREVPRAEAPCQQVVHRAPDVRAILPVPTHSEHDNGPYITAGMVIARNPANGVQNVSIHRIQVHAKDRMAILLLPRHLLAFYKEAEKRGQDLPVAVVIGADPLTLLASQAIAPIDSDELEVAGALHGSPLRVARCLTNDVHVPADAEIVIEGRILHGVREAEGPFGEFPKYYSAREQREVIAVDAITHRQSPIFHTIVPAEMEHLLLGSIPREATLLAHLQRSFPNVLDVHLSIGGVGRYHLYVKLRKTHEGQPKNVILGAFGAHYDIKQVIVVDDDVEVHDTQQVEWAVATRFQADRDLVVISGAQGSALDPSTTLASAQSGEVAPAHEQGISAKMGLDATRPVKYHEHTFTRVRVPGEDTVDLGAWVDGDRHVDFTAGARTPAPEPALAEAVMAGPTMARP